MPVLDGHHHLVVVRADYLQVLDIMKLISRQRVAVWLRRLRWTLTNWRESRSQGDGAVVCSSTPAFLGAFHSGSAEMSPRAFQQAQNEDWPPFNFAETPLSVFGWGSSTANSERTDRKEAQGSVTPSLPQNSSVWSAPRILMRTPFYPKIKDVSASNIALLSRRARHSMLMFYANTV